MMLGVVALAEKRHYPSSSWNKSAIAAWMMSSSRSFRDAYTFWTCSTKRFRSIRDSMFMPKLCFNQCVLLLLSAVATTVLFSAAFFHCEHDNSWTVALSLMKVCVSLFNIKVIGQRSRSHGLLMFLCAWYCGYLRTVLSLEQGLTILFWIKFML